jgi:DNA-binding winged helix-turn-helix (wHTH) protein/tetratricopeptide (TPR) repeat protein
MKVFQPFRLDTVNHRLWRAEERVPLTPKSFDVLRYLVEHAERLVTQDEILEAIWPETYVNPEVIKQYIRGIRKALGDDPEKPAYIETFPRRGYQFVAPVSDDSAASSANFSIKGIVGRKTALAELGACLASALRGKRQLVFVTGEAGIGKTTLVDAFHQQASFQPNLRIARGQCVEGFGGKEAYYPMLEALGQLVRDSDGSRVTQTLAKCAPTWLSQFPSLIKAEQREALQKETLGATRERMVREICDALETLTAESPLILIFEDLHWVDPSTLDLISAALRRRGPAKLLLLGTYRPTDVIISQSPLKALKQDLLVHKLCREIALERLEESDVAEYLTVEFAECTFAAAGLAKLVHRHSGGNALFMVGIVQSMLKKGVIAQLQGKWALTVPLEKIAPAVPDTLQQMIEAQFQQLSAPEQRILKSASVVGERFSIWHISTTLDIDAEQIEDFCEGLVERQQFITSAGVDELTKGDFSAHYEFRHSLYREVIYRRLSDVSRSKLHRDVAERFKMLCAAGKTEFASELALHLEGARDYEKAIRYLILASENASKRFAYQNSIRTLQQALELISMVPADVRVEPEIRILERIGDAHYALGDMLESARAFERAAVRAADAGLKTVEVNALCCLARTTVLIDGDLGIAACQRALTACQGINDSLLLARTELLTATLRLGYDQWSKEDAETCASARQAIALLSDSNSPSYQEIWDTHRQSLQGETQEAIKTADAAISRYYEVWDKDRQGLQGEYRGALRTAEAGVAGINQSSSLVGYVLSLSGKTIALMHLGQFGQALEILRSARSNAEKNGKNAWIFMLREAWLRMLVFDFQGAQRLCDEITDSNAEYLSGQPNAMAVIAAGYAALDEEDYERAIQAFGEISDRDPTPKFFLHWYWRMRAELGMSDAFLRKGDVSRAHRESDRFLQSALSTADPNLQALAWEMKTRVAMAEKRWNEGEECLQQALAILEKLVVPVSSWRVHETAWRLYGQRRDDEAAEAHRKRAEVEILALANSFAPDEPLRKSFLAAAPVRRILGESMKIKDPRVHG